MENIFDIKNSLRGSMRHKALETQLIDNVAINIDISVVLLSATHSIKAD